MTLHIATATVVKVSIGSTGSNSVAAFVRRGELVPDGVPQEQLDRLVKQGFIEEFDAPEVESEPPVFSQADVDAAVTAATKTKDDELTEARKEVDAAKAETARVQTELDTVKAAPAKPTAPAAKTTAAKQS